MVTLTVPAKTENTNQLMEFLEQQLEDSGCPYAFVMQLELVVEEIFVNIATHAYTAAGGMATMDCDVEKDKRQIRLRFTDSGIPFNPLTKKDPDISLSAEEREIGGLGIYLVKKTMDKCEYMYENGKNVFTVTKKY